MTPNGPEGKVLSVVIADDHAVTRSGLRLMIELVDGVRLVGEASTGVEAVRLCNDLSPDVVLMDLQMPEMSGLDAIRHIRREHPDVLVLVLTVNDDENSILEAVRAGAAGYLSKQSGLAEIAQGLKSVMDGGSYLSPSIVGTAIRGLSGMAHHDEASKLTEREQEVLELVVDGLTSRVIAERLQISERTVNTHINHCYKKLDVNNRVDAVLAAMRLGLVDTPSVDD